MARSPIKTSFAPPHSVISAEAIILPDNSDAVRVQSFHETAMTSIDVAHSFRHPPAETLALFNDVLPDRTQELVILHLRKFHCFKELPVELRLDIWCLIRQDDRRTINLSSKVFRKPTKNVPKYSPLFQICLESRLDIMSEYFLLSTDIFYTQSFESAPSCTTMKPPGIWYSPSRDYLDINICPTEGINNICVDRRIDGGTLVKFFRDELVAAVKARQSCVKNIDQIWMSWSGEFYITFDIYSRLKDMSLIQS